jgi:hypothetical protein
MIKRKELEAALAKAEAALALAVAIAAKVEGGQDEAIDKLEKARAYCRQAHATLVKHKRAGAKT